MDIMKRTSLLFVANAALCLARTVMAENNTFTYQGKLIDECCPANGYYDMRFKLVQGPSGSAVVSGTPVMTQPAVFVTNGIFTVNLNFGTGSQVFDGTARWLEIEVRTNNAPSGFVTLSPRTELSRAHEAVFAQKAASVLNGAVTAPSIASGQVVKSLNGLKDAVSLVAGANVTLTPSGNSIEIASTGGSSGWRLGGNAGTSPGIDFLGTTDGRAMEVRAPFVGVNRNTPITGADVFSVRSPATTGYGGMYVDTTGLGLPFYGYAMQGSARAWHFLDGTDGNKWKLYNNGVQLTVTPGGQVGIGTTTPGYRLDVNGRIRLRGEGVNNTAGIWLQANHASGADGVADIAFAGVLDATRIGFWGNDPRGTLGWGLTFDTVTGNVGIGTGNAYPTDKLHVNGSVRVGSLTITGGADLAEPFQMSEEQIPEGSVVIIDDANPGHLKQASQAYDTRVAGIVSGANGVKAGIALHQEGVLEGGQNVALTGRVYVRADAAFGAIKPGDLLTTSDTPGHAMKASNSRQAQGAILGKAMSKLENGQGMVLVLVSLQ
jgi:hypothetical protein